jgi:hypothetical protein
MIQVFKKRYPNLKISTQNGHEILMIMDLADRQTNPESLPEKSQR